MNKEKDESSHGKHTPVLLYRRRDDGGSKKAGGGVTEWISVNERLPEEKPLYLGTVSEPVVVRYSSGTEREDWLLNGKWVLYCEKSSTIGYPVAWRYKAE